MVSPSNAQGNILPDKKKRPGGLPLANALWRVTHDAQVSGKRLLEPTVRRGCSMHILVCFISTRSLE